VLDIARILRGSVSRDADLACLLKAQLLFWMLAATDGHAKNFSVFIEPRGRFSLTPLYDVLSAYPIMGHGKNLLAPEKVRMAMAVSGTRRHYHWSEIVRRHWLTTARVCDFNPEEAERLIAELIERTPRALNEVSAQLPRAFPASVAEPILHGLEKAAKQLEG
jgi:serine/threonine-protein kinase HipA